MTPWLEDTDVTLYHGDCLEVLRQLPDSSVHMCATSPPFYGLRDYGTEGQIGLEETPDEWVARLVAVFREVRRVLRDDGTLWVEIGDSYAASGSQNQGREKRPPSLADGSRDDLYGLWRGGQKDAPGCKPKDLIGQPWMLAFALRADGWYLRSEIIWARPNPMPESVTDRPTKSHSTVFLLTKNARYFYDADAIREPQATADPSHPGYRPSVMNPGGAFTNNGGWKDGEQDRFSVERKFLNPAGANARSVWQIPTEPTPFAHFATWPQALVRRMVLAGTSERGCCPECGAPWARETSHEYEHVNHTAPREMSSYVASRGEVANKRVTTLGWSPSCAHYESAPYFGEDSWDGPPPVPCTVLDPFAGSGTTSLVARNHGRHSIGIELNQQYLEIAAKRLQQLSLFASAEPPPAVRGHKGLTGGAYNPPGQSPHSNARKKKP